MGPTSILVLAGALLIAVGLLVAIALSRRVAVKVVAGAMTLLVTAFWGILAVNAYYGYYTSWSAAIADLNGSSNSYSLHQAARELNAGRHKQGRLLQIKMAGAGSGITRNGLVYLPPQYDEPAYRSLRFPVVELVHGTPGVPGSWVTQMRILRIVSQLATRHSIGPMVLVMPDVNGGITKVGECVDSHAQKDETYVAQDVPSAIRHSFRVSSDGAQWGLMGYSSGGYCAANLAMRHRTNFGAFAALDGYYRPTDGPAAGLLGNDPSRLAANDPLTIALGLRPGTGPVPAAWISAGTANGRDYQAGRRFVSSMRRLESVPFFTQRGAHHDTAAWRGALPRALKWMWQQLGSPAQHTRFPTGGHGGR